MPAQASGKPKKSASPRNQKSVVSSRPPAGIPPFPVQRFTVKDYHNLIELGLLTKYDRCHLVRGYLALMATPSPARAYAMMVLGGLFYQIKSQELTICTRLPITLIDSEPRPDLYLMQKRDKKFIYTHPTAADVEMIVEIADEMSAQFTGWIAELYAENKIREYWIVNIPERRIEVYTQPRGGKNPTYRTRMDYSEKESVPVHVGGKKVGEIAVKEVLP